MSDYKMTIAKAMSHLALPSMDDMTREDLEQLVRILHGAVCRAQADYELLAETTASALELLKGVTNEPADEPVRTLRLVPT